MMNIQKNKNGITLIALVVTIVVLLILAGVSINLVVGQNGLIAKAKESKEKTKMSGAKNQVSLVLGEWTIEKFTNGRNLKDFLHTKVTEETIDAVTETSEGFDIEKDGYIVSIDKDGNILGEPSKAGTRPQISDIKVVENSNGTGENLPAKSVDEGNTIYIIFSASLEGGTITEIKKDGTAVQLPYGVTSNGKYIFTVEGTVNGTLSSKSFEIIVNQFKSPLKVGDYVNYTYDAAEKYELTSEISGNYKDQTISQTIGSKWQILNINDDESIDLISENTVGTKIYFKYAQVYNNAVYFINDICEKQYSNKNLNITARNLTIEDIEKNMNSKGTAAINDYTNSYSVQYGETRTYTGSKLFYPNLYAKENGSGINTTITKEDGIGASERYYNTPTNEKSTSVESLTAKQTYYEFLGMPSEYFDNSKVYSMIFKGNYWLASRYVNCGSDSIDFGLRIIENKNLFNNNMYLSSDSWVASNHDSYYSLRPVVSLTYDMIDVSLGKDEDGAWQIKTK